MDEVKDFDFCMEWLNELLNSLRKNFSDEMCMTLLKPCSSCHLKHFRPLLKEYSGNLQGFFDFVEKEWGQKIVYDKDKREIVIDENKNYCVCPIAKSMKGSMPSPTLCNCSAVLTAGMIEEVTGKKAKAEVVKSVLRGDSTCIYRIEILDI